MTGGRAPAGVRRPWTLTLIALFRLTKALVLVAVALGALRLLDRDVAARVHAGLDAIPFVARHAALLAATSKVAGTSHKHLAIAASVALAYAALFAVEGVGLWRQRVWAEYLTIVATSSFIPFELYALTRRFTPIRLGALAVNVAIVTYLVIRRVRAGRGESGQR
jgi:uncharacterized membrane protein (DUF2068 family)